MSNTQEAERSCSCASHWFARGWRCYCFADELLPEDGGVISVMPSSFPGNGTSDNLREFRLQLFFQAPADSQAAVDRFQPRLAEARS